METEIGPTLREARIRRKIDLTEIERQTKIRVRYLRALENEEWGLLPGGAYTRSFIRTYAMFLGLDGERLSDEYRRAQEEPAAEPYPRVEPSGLPAGPGGGRGEGPRIGVGTLAILISVGLILLLVLLSVTGGSGDGGGEGSKSAAAKHKAKLREQKKRRAARAEASGKVSIDLTAEAEVWVCLVDSQGSPLVNGQILTTGQTEGPFKSGRFAVRFGNGSIQMDVNGEPAQIEDTGSPVGYAIDPGGKVRAIPDSEQPTCA